VVVEFKISFLEIKAESLLIETKALATQNEKRNTKSMCEDGRNISD